MVAHFFKQIISGLLNFDRENVASVVIAADKVDFSSKKIIFVDLPSLHYGPLSLMFTLISFINLVNIRLNYFLWYSFSQKVNYLNYWIMPKLNDQIQGGATHVDIACEPELVKLAISLTSLPVCSYANFF